MKVKELMEILKNQDLESDVVIRNLSGSDDIAARYYIIYQAYGSIRNFITNIKDSEVIIKKQSLLILTFKDLYSEACPM